MIIGEKKIFLIRNEFRLRFNAFLFKIAGPQSLSKFDLDELVEKGYVTADDHEHGIVADAYKIARVRSGTPHELRPVTTVEEFRKDADRITPTLSSREQYALKHIKQSTGNFITKLRDSSLASIEGEIRAYNYDERNRMLTEIVRPTVEQGITEAKTTVSEIASRLRERTKDIHRDWKRVAVTEMSNALNLGAADAIMERNSGQHPDDVSVYKIAHIDNVTCNKCREFYLEPDGITPKVYRMSDLMGNGSNYGKKARDWKATIGATHPNERCELVELPQGWGFEKGSNQATFMGKDYVWLKDRNQ